jgi:GNAT superfamily N-acetyltransferase
LAKGVFTEACKFGPKGESIINWESYGQELSGATDWYHLYHQEVGDASKPKGTGHLFIQLFDTLEMKEGKHMPTEGEFSKRYLYIGLVCGQGLGKYFMNIAEEASRALGCEGIVLATMVNSAGFYHSQEFKFMDKTTGSVINVDQYIEQRVVNGRAKPTLLVNYDTDDPHGHVRDADEALVNDAARRATRRRRILPRLSYFG